MGWSGARRLWATVVLLAAACPALARPTLESAARLAERGEWRSARVEYDALAARAELERGGRVRAWIGAALACERLGDGAGARERLERAVAAEVPGESEPAMYYLADELREGDRARALNLYYRAAAGAEKNRAGGFPYRAAIDRILQLSMAR